MVILYIQVMEVFLSHHLLYRQEAVQALVLVQEVVTMIMAAIHTTVQETTADIQPVQEVVMKTVTVQETTYQVQAAITIQETMETVHTIQEIINQVLQTSVIVRKITTAQEVTEKQAVI